MIEYLNDDVKDTYINYSVSILNKLDTIRERMKTIHANDKRIRTINYAHIGDLARIDCDLGEIIDYL